MPKEIIVKVTPLGDVQITTTGYSGSECQKATESLERALGTKTSDTPTAEASKQQARHNLEAR